MHKLLSFILILFLLFSHGVFAKTSELSSSCKIEYIDEYKNISNLLVGINDSIVGFIFEKEGKKYLFVNGETSDGYDDIIDVSYSLDGSTISSIVENEGEYFVITRLIGKDGFSQVKDILPIIDQSEKKQIKNILYSNNSKRVLYTIRKENKSFIVAKGFKSKLYDSIYDVRFSGNAKNITFIGVNESGKEVFVKDGIESNEYSSIKDIIYSSDKNKTAFIGLKENGKEVLVKDGIESNEYDRVFKPLYSLDGNSFSFVYRNDDKVAFVKDGRETSLYDSISDYTYTSDSKKLVFIGKKDDINHLVIFDDKIIEYISSSDINIHSSENKINFYSKINFENQEYLIVNGIKGNIYDKIVDIFEFEYSHDEKELFFIAKDNGEFKMLLNNKEIGSSKFIYGYKFFPKTKKLAYINKKENNKYVLVFDGDETNEYDNIQDIYSSSDEKSVSFVAEKSEGDYVLVTDGVESKGYNYITDIKYSSNSKSVSFVAEKSEGDYVLVTDGVESKGYNYITDIKYLSDNRVSFITLNHMIIDGNESDEYTNITDIKYSIDGKYVGFLGDLDYQKVLNINGFSFISKENIANYGFIPNSNYIYLESSNHHGFNTYILDIKCHNKRIIDNIELTENNKNGIDNIVSEKIIMKNLIISRYNLSKIKVQSRYINEIDQLIINLDNKFTKEDIIKIYNKLESYDLNSDKYKKIKYVILYFKYKIGMLYYKI